MLQIAPVISALVLAYVAFQKLGPDRDLALTGAAKEVVVIQREAIDLLKEQHQSCEESLREVRVELRDAWREQNLLRQRVEELERRVN